MIRPLYKSSAIRGSSFLFVYFNRNRECDNNLSILDFPIRRQQINPEIGNVLKELGGNTMIGYLSSLFYLARKIEVAIP